MHQTAGDMAILWSQNLPRVYAFLGSGVVMPCLSGATTSTYTDMLGFFLRFALLFPFVLLLLQSSYDDVDTDCKNPREYLVTRVNGPNPVESYPTVLNKDIDGLLSRLNARMRGVGEAGAPLL